MQLIRMPVLTALAVALGFSGVPRYDQWKVIGPGGGGGNFLPTVSPHNTNDVLDSCDMTGGYISHDGGNSWRMFNLGNRIVFFLFDPADAKVIYAKTGTGPQSMEHDRPVSSPELFRSDDSGRTWRVVRADSDARQPLGEMTALAVDPSDSKTLYAALRHDRASVLAVSTDRGESWTKMADLADGGTQILVDPRSPRNNRTLYITGATAVTVRDPAGWHTGAPLGGLRSASAGFPEQGGKPVIYAVARRGLFVSEDGGANWRQSSLPALTYPLLPVVVATSLGHPGVAYVSYNNHRRGSEQLFGVAKTTDRGHTWTLVWKEGLESAPNIHDSWLSQVFGPGWGGNPFNLGVAPTDPNICYGTDDGRTMRTTDGGKTWVGVYSTREPDGAFRSTGLDVTTNYGVFFDPFDLKRMFIGYTDIGLFRSENGGRSWTSSMQGVPSEWENTTYWITFDPKVRGRVWGVMSWAHDLPRPKMWGRGESIGRFKGGVCRSDDGGRTWKVSNKGMPETAATDILLDPNSLVDARVLYVAGLGHGVYKSIDGGAHWSRKSDGIAGNEPLLWRLVRDTRGTLYAVVARRSDDGSIGGPGDGALYRSTDGAGHWTAIKLPEGTNGPEGLAVDPSDPRRLYLAAWGRRPELARATGGGIFLSTDGGGSWRQVLSRDQHVYDVTVDPRDPKIAYACGFEASAWRTADRGEHWRRIRGFNFKWGHRVIPDPVDPSKIYITTYGGGVWHGPATGDPAATEDIVGRER